VTAREYLSVSGGIIIIIIIIIIIVYAVILSTLPRCNNGDKLLCLFVT
jgi:hypothetical protein